MPSVSKSQQRLMGMAYAVKSGDMELSDIDPAYRDKVKSLSDGMTKKDLKKYAATKHDGLPETVDENAMGAVSLNPGMTIGGIGDPALPTATEFGSGDVPAIADIDDDEEEAKKDNTKKKLEMENFNLYTQFSDFLKEATDYNDPVLIRLRQDKLRRADMAKLDALKKEAEKDRKKAMKRWNQKKYDQWLEDVASNGGWENAFDMAQNAEFEPGLVDWVKKENPYDDAYQRIQWDIEAFAESVVTEAKKYKAKDIIDAWEDAYGEDIMNSDHADVPEDIDNDYRGRVTIKDLEEIFDDRYGEELSPEFLEALGESVVNEKKLGRDDMIKWIENHMRFVSTTEEFNGSQGGIWVSGEDGDEFKGRVIYDYYSEDYKNRTFGVDNKWEKELNKRGWYSEWHDAGTSMIWPL